MSSAGGGELEDECVEGLGQHDGLAAEPEPHVLRAGVNLVEGEAADRGGPLGVKEKEQSGDAVFGFEGVVVEQAAGVVPSGFGVDNAAGPGPSGGGEVEASQFLAPGPADEVPGLAAMGGVIAGQPGVKVALPCGGQVEAAGGEPVQQRDRGRDVSLDGAGLAAGDVLAAGAAAGMSATFNTPIAGVILAIELLLFEFKSRSFIPLVIASTLATAVHMQLLGAGPMFQVGAMDFGIPHALPFYLVLGPICGLAAVGLSKTLYWVEDLFENLPFDELWWPAVGALALGVIGYFVPRVFGVGYDTIGDILNGHLVWKILLVVMIAKFAALVISLGSGTSGGLLAPTFMWSAAMGGLFAMIANQAFPSAHLSPGAFALVAMGAVFGAAARAAFSFIIFAFEITRDYNSVLPLMLVAVIADGIAMLFMPNSSIMTEKLARRGLRVHQDYEADALTQATVGETMEKEAPVIRADTKVGELAERIVRHDPAVARHEALLILDDASRLAGIITRGDVLRALDKDSSGAATVQEAGSTHLVVTYPDELVSEAAAKLLRFDIGRLPVVDRADERKVVGYLGRATILAARLLRFHDEHVREPGWLTVAK